MSKLKLAVASAAALVTGVIAGPALGGVHVQTVAALPVTSGVWQPGVVSALGVDANELGPIGRAASRAGAGGSASPKASGALGGPEGGWSHRSESRDKNHDEGGGNGGDHRNGGGLTVPSARGSNVVGPPSSQVTFHGLDHWDQRFGPTNQFSLEPPDQGLCVGGPAPGGQVLEVVNSVMRSYLPNGTPSSPQISLNEFFGYPPAVIRDPNFIVGPQITDPSCIFDQRAQKYVIIALTYDVVPSTGQPTGVNRIDIGVTTAAAPTVLTQRYSIPVQDDGTAGTPSHPNCPCIGDFPQFGMDKYGFHITTNEYPFFADGFNGAQLYSFSRKQLEVGSPVLRIVHYDDLSAGGGPAFTVWPAKSNEGDYNRQSGGTENFLSSMAAPEAGNTTGIDNRIAVWWLRNTWALDTPTPEAFLRLTNQVVGTETYAIPPPSDQKAGNIPLADCLNHDPCSLILNGEPDPYKPEVQGPLDSSDTRMLTHWYVNGTLLGALDTALKVNGKTKAGIAWFAFDAQSAQVLSQGYLGVANNNVIYPAIATLLDGRGAMAFTLAGRDWYPTAAYAPVQAGGGNGDNQSLRSLSGNGNGNRGNGSDGNGGGMSVGNPTVASPGIDAQDGFSEYKYYSPTGDGVPRPRWGDYGAAVSTGSDVWIASEYIGQTCGTSAWEHFAATGFQCGDDPSGHRRTALANWGTRVTKVALPPAENQQH